MKKFLIFIAVAALTIAVFILGKQYSEQTGLFKANTFFGELKIN